MIIEVKIPTPGESITQVEIARWLVEDGAVVIRNQELAEVESDKATISINAPESGKIIIIAPLNTPIPVGSLACTIDTSFKPEIVEIQPSIDTSKKEDKKPGENIPKATQQIQGPVFENIKVTPLAKKLMEQHHLSVKDIIDGLQKIGKEEVEAVLNFPSETNKKSSNLESIDNQNYAKVKRIEERQRLSSLRRKLSERLVAVKNQTAMLTTFNELDMSAVMSIRNKYKDKFFETHGVKLGFMSFFTKAVTESLKAFPQVGSMIDGDDLITPNYADIAIAVQAPKGLMVPVIRNAEVLTLADIEAKIAELAEKARNNRLSIEEMRGGNFTITNGGVFGSLFSTPILNPPQSAILGMHNIVDRPVAINGKVEIRPMMYIALSYDHRVIDGATSVRFLVNIKELIENPYRMLIGGKDPEKALLGL